MNRRPAWIVPTLIVLGVIVIAGLFWGNYRYCQQNPGGNDFLPRWLGTQLFLYKGQSPYSVDTTQAIQEMTYGRAAKSGEDQVLFVYPLYSFLAFMPFAVIKDFVLARSLWMTFLELCLLAVAVTSLVLSRWRISILMLVSLLTFSALWYHGVRPVINGNASVLCALYITLAFWLISHDQDALAGLMLALASIKPQMVVLLIPFVILWAFSQRRWVLIWSMIVCTIFLIAIGALFIPDWFWQNLIQLFAYPSYTLPGSPGAIFAAWLPGVGRQMGWVVTVFMAGILLWEWRAAWGKDLRWFLWAAYLTLTITNLIGVRTATENYITLFPGLVLVLAVWDERWGKLGRSLVIFSLILLFFGLWALFLVTLIPGDQPTQSPVMFFPLPIFMMIGLYWARWWAVRPPPPLLDQLRKTVEIG